MAFEDPKDNLIVLEKYATQNSKSFTLEDAVSVTGMPVIETDEAIKNMMEKYDCKLKVTENGDLIYDFGTILERRHKKSWSEYVADFMHLLWRGFQISYKVLTSIFLVVYFVFFILLLIGAAIAMEDGDGLGDLVVVLLRIFVSIFEWKTIMGYNDRYYRKDDYGYNYQHYKEKPRILGKKKKPKDPKDEKGFVASIYDFIFGPPRVELDPLENNQEVATFLKEQKGLITTSEIQALAGWTREEAENFMTECLGMFDGKGNISDNGTLYGDFSQLIRAKDRTGEAPVIWYWDEYEPAYELTGNSKKRNAIIIAVNTFNLIMSIALAFGSFIDPLLIGFWGSFFLAGFPLVYSSLFFLIPLIRSFRLRPLRRKQHELNIRKRLMRVVFQTYNQSAKDIKEPSVRKRLMSLVRKEEDALNKHVHEIPLSKLTEVANAQRETEETLNPTIVDKVMKDTLADLGGEAYLNAEGETIYKFELISQELNAIDALRADKKEDNDLGDVIFEA